MRATTTNNRISSLQLSSYSCDVCGRTFQRKVDRRRHAETHHAAVLAAAAAAAAAAASETSVSIAQSAPTTINADISLADDGENRGSRGSNRSPRLASLADQFNAKRNDANSPTSTIAAADALAELGLSAEVLQAALMRANSIALALNGNADEEETRAAAEAATTAAAATIGNS